MREILKKTTVFLKENKKIALVLLTVFVFVDIFLIKINSDIVIFSTLLLYGIFIKNVSNNKQTNFFVMSCVAGSDVY
jgi:hypothetical protein